MSEPTRPSADNAEPEWKRFEKIVASLHQTPGVTVEHDVKSFGASGCEYQLDVRVTHPAPVPHRPFVILISCKDWRHRVDRPAVAEFKAVLDDCRASRGAMFSSSGFTEGATQYATHQGIDLFHLADLDDAVLEGFIRRVELKMRLTAPHVDGSRLLVAEALPDLAPRLLFQEDAELRDRSGTTNLGNVVDIINREFGAKLEDRDGPQTVRIDFPNGSHLRLGARLVAVEGIEVTGHRTVLQSSFHVDLGDTVRAALDNIVTRERRWLRHDGTISQPAQQTIKPVD